MSSKHGNRQKYESRNPVQQYLLRHFLSQVVQLVRSVQPKSILDVGCGEGYVLDGLLRHEVDASLFGVDMSEEAIAQARERLGTRADVQRQDARALAAEDRRFDLVMMLEVLEHLDEPAEMLPVLARLSNAHVLLSVPHEPFFRGLNLMRGKNVAAWGNDPEHVNHWGRRSFHRFVSSHFEVVSAPLAFPWTLVLCRPISSGAPRAT